MSDDVILSGQEQQKFDIITRVLQHQITNGQAATMLSISLRQIQRLKQEIRRLGKAAVVHKLTGRKSNHALAASVKETVLQTITTTYPDFKPGFATEKLEENHQIKLTSQTVRVWMTAAGLWKPRKQKKTGRYRSWRPRKEYFGEMQQFDGSYHLWFENRYIDRKGAAIEVCLLAAIDDATGKITRAIFAANEGVIAVFTFWKNYVRVIGKPSSIYLDKFSTYKITHKVALDNQELLTQFQRATNELSIRLIPAHSPEAKGRIERLFGTLQDRLVKEMRLAGINNPTEGNIFLEKVFLPKFTAKFAVIPSKEGDVHRLLTPQDTKNLRRIFSVQCTRQVNNDFTIQFKNQWYQLAEVQPVTVRAKDTVLVEEWLNGTVHFSLREKYLVYILLPSKPQKVSKPPLILTTHRLNWKPLPNHPWRKYPEHLS
jgi:hypothetical protein